jgi:hypothetical protein
MRFNALLLVTAIIAIAASAGPSTAQYSREVKQACKGEYKRYCGEYAPQDPGLRECMHKVGCRLAKGCLNALIAAGEIRRERVSKACKR